MESHTSFPRCVILTVCVALITGSSDEALCAGLPDSIVLPGRTGSFVEPTRLASDPSGRLFVGNASGGKVIVLDAVGRELQVQGGLGRPVGMAVDGQGRVYIGDADTGRVNVYDSEWRLTGYLGRGTGEFLLPGHICANNENGVTTVFVSDGLAHCVKAYREGILVGQFGNFGMGPGEFDFPAGLCVGPDGLLYVVDQNNDRVQVFKSSGGFIRWFSLQGNPGQFGNSGRGQGIARDSAGRLYVADAFQGRISVFDLAGSFIGWLGSYGKEPGKLRLPGGICLDSFGRLCVANAGNGRVEVFGLDCFIEPSIYPAEQFVAAGSTVRLSVAAGCTAGSTFQWYKGTTALADGGNVSGATSSNLTLAPVTSGDAGVYHARLSREGAIVSSPSSELRVTGAPLITSSPATQNVPTGSTVTLKVGASGEGLSYRWFFNGNELPVASKDTLILTNAQLLMSGKYWAVVTNVAGSATSAQATLTVMILPYIVSSPTNISVAERGTATFIATAGGSLPLTYQWFRGLTLLQGQTASVLVLSNVSPVLNGSYSVRVSNAAGATNSASANLSVVRDTVAPVALTAAGGAANGRTVLVSFSEAVNTTSARVASNYELGGPGSLSVLNAVVTNNSRVLLTLSGNRMPTGDYTLKIQNVTDTAYAPNLISPNPSMLSVLVADEIGTVAWWPMNEAAGAIARDATGRGSDAALESATWTSGRSGAAVNLDGTASDLQFPALNIQTNTATIAGWIRRSGSQNSSSGIVFTRAGASIAGVRFGSANELRYVWNDSSSFNSGLIPTDGAWAFFALVVEPGRAVMHLNTGSGFQMATNTIAHAIEEFNGIGYMGWDPAGITRRFRGALDDVRICSRALTTSQIQALYNAVATPASCLMAQPPAGAVVAGPLIPLIANVSSNGNTIQKVEFIAGTAIVGTARTVPYSCTWTNPVAGTYSVKARVYFGPSHYVVDSAPRSFTVVIPIVLAIQPTQGGLWLSWSGGNPPYQVQTKPSLAAVNWVNAAPETNGTSIRIAPTQAAAFYRVMGR